MNSTTNAKAIEHFTDLNAVGDGKPSSSSTFSTPAFWEGLWRSAGIQFVGLFIFVYLIYGYQPGVRGSGDELVSFYNGNSTRILIAIASGSLNLLNLLWFAAALRTTLADLGKDGWGAAVTASSTAFGALFFLLVSIAGTLAYSVVGSGNNALISGMNDYIWVLVVLSSFPRAMLIMAGSFGFWRAGIISNAIFATGVTAMALVLLGGTTWMSDGIWAPDGVYSRFVSPIISLVWVAAVSRLLSTQKSSISKGW